MSTSDIATALRRIESCVADEPRTHRRDVDAARATTARLRWSQLRARPLPAELDSFWEFTERLALCVDGIELLRAVTALDEWQTANEASDGEVDANIECLGPVAARGFCSDWIPFALVDGSSAYHCVDLAPAAGGTVGQILALELSGLRREVIAPSLASYLERLATAFEARELELDGDEFVTVGAETRYFERHGYVPFPPPVRPRASGMAPSPTQEPVREVARALEAGDLDVARRKLSALCIAWLGPAVVGAVNQHIDRKQLLELFDMLAAAAPLDSALESLRARIAAAPLPEVALPEGDFL